MILQPFPIYKDQTVSAISSLSYGNEGSSEIIQDRRNGFLVRPARFEEITAITKITNYKGELETSIHLTEGKEGCNWLKDRSQNNSMFKIYRPR